VQVYVLHCVCTAIADLPQLDMPVGAASEEVTRQDALGDASNGRYRVAGMSRPCGCTGELGVRRSLVDSSGGRITLPFASVHTRIPPSASALTNVTGSSLTSLTAVTSAWWPTSVAWTPVLLLGCSVSMRRRQHKHAAAATHVTPP
jgi:hypothetical protein